MSLSTPSRSRPVKSEPWPASLTEPEALGFGRHVAPFVVMAEHEEHSGWSTPVVLPRAAVQLDVASGALQYGLSVFEGLKAYRDANDELHLFRPREHILRLQRSAERLSLPAISEALLMKMLCRAVDVHRDWVPPYRRGSLYLRPTLYACEESLGLRRAAKHALSIVATPCSSPDTSTPKRLWAERTLARAAVGGLGAAKTAANYAASLYGAQQARLRGCDDALWLDAAEHCYLGEAGTMNVFVALPDRVLTPPLDGTILAGITRVSIMQLLAEFDVRCEQTAISLDDLQRWQQSGGLREIFGVGTAAGVAPVSEIAWENARVLPAGGDLAARLSQRLADLQDGAAEDRYGWRTAVRNARRDQGLPV
ncbi:MAG: Branched-chain-amino-acid aminotransferase [Hydrocarboniphaga sp.]|uniref:branched-chain amino acid aminotransferase n=1 Tax=Hydrocarboniphaga sp. TaxID=2033016 RepID=UPI002617185A|nr:branched-chain amino acid aminotransferase [Hydrocarboniphaga sp.]MDB5970906.1 Branched-chain-amino-acid aminotransferase [Hydrocarboniphaga sp.]